MLSSLIRYPYTASQSTITNTVSCISCHKCYKRHQNFVTKVGHETIEIHYNKSFKENLCED